MGPDVPTDHGQPGADDAAIFELAASRFGTPLLLMDTEIFRRNAREIDSYAKTHGLTVVPHFKTIKSLELLEQLFTQFGGRDVAVSKVGEAEIAARAAPRRITVAYPPVGMARVRRLAALAAVQEIEVTIDVPEQVAALTEVAKESAHPVGVVLSVDAGMKRFGISSAGQAASLAQLIVNSPRLFLAGCDLYCGQFWERQDQIDDPATFMAINRHWREIYETLRPFSHNRLAVTVASSPVLFHAHEIEFATHIRVGARLLNDLTLVHHHRAPATQIAAEVLSTVIGTPSPQRLLLDVGAKALSRDKLSDDIGSLYGALPDWPNARIDRLNEELSWVDVSRCQSKPAVGAVVRVQPVDASMTMSCFDEIVLKETGALRSIRLEARGKFT